MAQHVWALMRCEAIQGFVSAFGWGVSLLSQEGSRGPWGGFYLCQKKFSDRVGGALQKNAQSNEGIAFILKFDKVIADY